MRVIISFLTGAAALGTASLLEAQQPRTPAPPRQPAAPRATTMERNCVNIGEGKVECRVFRFGGADSVMTLRRARTDSAMMKRAVLGMQLSATGSLRDTLGVFVARVTPKGPAENAGVVEGDRIASINGVDLRVSASDAGDSYASGLPSHRLSREVGKLTPGTVVTLRVSSGGRIRDVRVTTGRASDYMKGDNLFGFGFGFGGDGNAFMYRNGPSNELAPGGTPRMPMMRMHALRRLPMIEHLEMLPMQMENFEPGMKLRRTLPLGEGARIRSLSPPRIRTDDEEDYLIVDAEGSLLPSSVQSESAKAKLEAAAAARKAKAKRK